LAGHRTDRDWSGEEKWPHSFEQPPEIFKWSLC
jgi:hypothetical protein